MNPRATLVALASVAFFMIGCVSTNVTSVVGDYSLDTSRFCSFANQVSIHIMPDGTVVEEGLSPGVVDEEGTTYSWQTEGRWRVEDGVLIVEFDGSGEQRFRMVRVRSGVALRSVAAPGDRSEKAGVRYNKWREE